MKSNASPAISKNLNKGDKSWTFFDGSKRTVVFLGNVVIGRGEYKPGWQWSKHIGAMTGKESKKHIGYIISGKMCVKDADGEEVIVGPGEAFKVGPRHDGWVVGDELCIALDFKRVE